MAEHLTPATDQSVSRIESLLIPTTVASLVDVVALVDALLQDDAPRINQLLAPLALDWDNPLTGCYFMLEGTDVQTRLVGLQALATHLRMRGDVRMAAKLAVGLIDGFERAGWFDASVSVPQRLAVANVLDLCAGCLSDGGYAPRLLERARDWSAWLERAQLPEQWKSVQNARVEACFHAGRYEEAEEILKEIAARFPDSARSAIGSRLWGKLDDLLRATDQPDTPSPTLRWIVQATGKDLGLDAFEPGMFEEMQPEGFEDAVKQMGRQIGLAPAPEGYEGIAQAVGLLPRAAHPLHQTSELLNALRQLLESAEKPYLKIAALAARVRSQALAFGFWEQAMTAGWVQTVALRRTGAFDEAATVLADLRESVRERQELIRQPMLRAALAEYLPCLSGVSAEVLFDLGVKRADELFEVIEGSKGQILAALAGARPHGAERTMLPRLRALLERSSHAACYVTFLADQDQAYVAAVVRGKATRAARLPIPRSDVAAAAQELAFLNDGEPGSLTRAAGIDPDDPFEVDYTPVLGVLAPFAQWLESLLDSGFIEEDSILCISPDGPLCNLPLAVLDVAAKPLIERFALTTVPCAEVLESCAGRRTRIPRSRAFTMSVPRSTEFDGVSYDMKLFRSDADAAARCWAATTCAPEASDPERLLREDLLNSVVHIGSHGYFEPVQPLDHSGLVLAADGVLPAGRGYAGERGRLTPRMAARLNAAGAHVTLRACVSGKTTQVTAREALGMIWALFQAGASSVVAASWHADVRSAATLLTGFYPEFARHESAPLALRAAALSMRNSQQTWRHPYHFAAFNAYGYWN